MKRLLLDNIWWKLLSLAMAVLLWFVTVGTPEYFMQLLPVPVRSLIGG